MSIKINEIFKTISGESSFAGYLCVIVRLTGCNLRCSYCDTEYAFNTGVLMEPEDLVDKIKGFKVPLVTITGGEPLLQEGVYRLTEMLLERGFNVTLETNGTCDCSKLDERVIKVIDVKCPDSGMSDKIFFDNIININENDELKFVISGKDDYQWSKNIISKYSLENKCKIIFSPVISSLTPKLLSKWIIDDNLYFVRLGLQIHKILDVR